MSQAELAERSDEGNRGTIMAKKGNTLKPGDRRTFVCLQLDIVGHSKLSAPDRDLHKAKELFHRETTRIVEAHGGRSFKWEGDGGAFLFLVTDDSEFERSCQAAFAILDSLPQVNQEIRKETGLAQPLHVRISLDSGEARYDPNPGLITGDFLNAFLKYERAIARPDAVVVTERVFKQLAQPTQARFVRDKHSTEVESQLYRSVVEGQGGDHEPVRLWLDSSRDAFVGHLVAHDAIWIVGITNEHLVDYLRDAFESRKGRPWDEVRVLFQARHLVKEFREGGAERGPAWEEGVKGTIDFFLQEGAEKAKKLDIRHVNRILPFVGQFYDYRHVRVAFVLPLPDIRTSCYLNCRAESAGQGDDPGLPPRERREAVTQYQALRAAFEHLRNVSTPLLTANVIGRRAADGSFRFESLLPQDNWRHSSVVSGGRMAHLVTFILLYDEHHLYLQLRDENNSNGQLRRLGVLPGKVNDEDFFPPEAPPHRAYRNQIYEMQKAFDELPQNTTDSPAAKQKRQRATEAFSSATLIQPQSVVPTPRLLEVCRRAAARYLDEKLGLIVPEGRLQPVRDEHFYVEKPDYSLYVQLYGLRLTSGEMEQIPARRPFANLERRDLKDFEKEKADGTLTLFLDQYFKEIFMFLKGKLG